MGALCGGVLCAGPSAGGSTVRAGSARTAGDWATFGYDTQRSGSNPVEHQLGTAQAPLLHSLWAADLGGVSDTQPLVARSVSTSAGRRDLVLAGSEGGFLTAVDAADGRVLWRRYLGAERTRCHDTPGGVYGVTATPVIDRRRGAVYAVGGDDRAYGLDLATGRTLAGWPVALGAARAREHVWGALTISRGVLFVATAGYCDLDYYRGRLVAVDLDHAKVGPGWHASPRFGGGIWGWGGAAVDPGSGDLFVATANAGTPGREDLGYAEHVVRLSRSLRVGATDEPRTVPRQDNDFGAAPLLFRAPHCPQQMVVVRKPGLLLLYDSAAIARGARQRIQIGSLDALTSFGTYARSQATGLLYVSNSTDGPAGYGHGLLAFRSTPACGLALAWQQPFGSDGAFVSPPVVAGGVVYYGDGQGRRVAAFDAVNGRPLWDSLDAIAGPTFAAPSVAGGRLYVAAWDGRLRAFGP